jgi:hypothetical protein
MPEKFVARLAEFKDGERRIVFAGDNETVSDWRMKLKR